MRRLLLILTTATALLVPAATASANRSLESMFQDDPRILSSDPAVRNETLDELQSLGVQRIRLTAYWSRIAPDSGSATKPAGFDGSDPAAYPAANWALYDQVIREIKAHGMSINLNPTAPEPRWAGSGYFKQSVDDVTNPNPAEYGAFVAALGRRYSGSFVPAGQSSPLPRIDYWSIWNEPNQGGWLSPQWQSVRGRGTESSPAQYRALLDGAWIGLQATQHGSDTILIGDTAPKGIHRPKSSTNAMAPIRFLRRLYCVDDHNALLKGKAAERLGCAAKPDTAQFVAQHPALFRMTGYAHHPYELLFAPDRVPHHPAESVTTGNLGSLSDTLDRLMGRYKVKRSGIPLYLTEYGYQTDPPDHAAVSLAKQAAYLNEGEYIAWRNRDVRTLSQFLLRDDAPRDGDYGATFQSGLRTLSGKAKPALAAYRVAFYVPHRHVHSTRKMRIWGHVRPGSGRRTVTVQWRPLHSKHYRTLKSRLKTDSKGFLAKTVRVRGRSGAVRLSWTSGRHHYRSRGISYTVNRRR